MNAATEGYGDLIKRIEDGFMEIDHDIIMDLRKQDTAILHFVDRLGIWKKNIRLY